MNSMLIPDDVVLVFDRDEGLSVFSSAEAAAQWLEAIDVAEGEYPAAFSTSGLVVLIEAPEGLRGPVIVTKTGVDRRSDLELRVTGFWHRHQVGQVPRSPEMTACFLLERDGESRRGLLWRLRNSLRRGGTERSH